MVVIGGPTIGSPVIDETAIGGGEVLQAGPPDLLGHLRRRTLITIRWIAVAGQTTAVLIVAFALGYPLPLAACMTVIGASVLVNMVAMAQGRPRTLLPDRDAAVFLTYDIVQLTALLYLTGGITNPFVVLLLAPQMVAALVLSQRRIVILTLITVAGVAGLALWQYPLPQPEAEAADMVSLLYRVGVWVAMTLATVFITAYVWRVAEEGRALAAALAETRVALAREQQVSAVGGLAAAAAHELGTPLGTIVLTATELADDLADRLPDDDDVNDDAALLVTEAQRCRDILARLTRDPRSEGGEPFELLTLSALVDTAADPFRHPDKQVIVEVMPRDSSRPPLTTRRAEIVHGLGNILQNAIQFARHRVSVRAEWSKEDVSITILDDGPGYAASVIHKLGEPYVSGRTVTAADSAGHMGLGIFIAVMLLGRTGATVRFSNARRGGAHVTLRWPRERYETRV